MKKQDVLDLIPRHKSGKVKAEWRKLENTLATKKFSDEELVLLHRILTEDTNK